MLHTTVIARHGLETFESMVANLNSDQTTYIKPTIDPDKEYKVGTLALLMVTDVLVHTKLLLLV